MDVMMETCGEQVLHLWGRDAEHGEGTGWGACRTLLPVTTHPKIPPPAMDRTKHISLLGDMS